MKKVKPYRDINPKNFKCMLIRKRKEFFFKLGFSRFPAILIFSYKDRKSSVKK